MTSVEFAEVTLLPCVRDGSQPTGYSAGAFGPDGLPIAAFDHPWCGRRDPRAAPSRISGTVVYGGVLMSHFGHFLVEAMSRLWFVDAHPELPIAWRMIDLPTPHTPWKGWMEETWRLLGLNERGHHMIRAPARIERVVAPQPGLIAGERIHPWQAQALARVRDVEATVGPRLWLSRSGLPQQFGRIEGEDALEAELASRGWSVVRPETLPVAAQAGLFAGAQIVAGFAGSAFHSVLLTAAPRARLLVLERPSVSRNYYAAAAAARGLRQDFLAVAMQPLGPVNAWTTFRLADPAKAAQTVVDAAG